MRRSAPLAMDLARVVRALATRPRGWVAIMLALASALGVFVPTAAATDRASPTTFTALVGAETKSEAIQALAFLPNNVTVDVGDTVTWTFPTHEPHTLTFVPAGQTPPPFTAPGTPSGTTFDGKELVNSGIMLNGGSFTVTFGATGDFHFVCLIHARMNGTMHVRPAGTPHDEDAAQDLVERGRHRADALLRVGERRERDERQDVIRDTDDVTIGSGAVRTTAGGDQSVMIARFLPGTRHAHVGETITWTATDPATPHTVTFGPAPANPAAVIGASHNHAVLPTTPAGQTVSSGFLGAPFASQHFSVTFNAPGTYDYYCALHRDLGMRGTIIVQ